ncbi:hypothetical protein AYI70_g12386 [Smittium culicis]|uniref:Uncharacterized protein n=1 Tax=Smittium culicis TaxID=133412 RepID=A0A1R1WXP7_9FUNG|nr:hypothetical protein AYI70_g12386 [Smittium culicis]
MENYNIVLIGCRKTGKTTLIRKFLGKKTSKISRRRNKPEFYSQVSYKRKKLFTFVGIWEASGKLTMV